jgi:uroporphyrinogen decarboxylase
MMPSWDLRELCAWRRTGRDAWSTKDGSRCAVNSRERVRLALTCQIPDRIPKALAFFPQPVPEIAPAEPEEYFNLDIRYAEFNPLPVQDAFLGYLGNLPEDVHVGNLSQLRTYYEWGYRPGATPAGPLAGAGTAEEIIEFVLPDLADPDRHAGLSDQVAAWHAGGLAVAGSPPHLGGELFETAYRLRGFDNFLADLLLHKHLARYLLDQISDLMLQNALILAQARVDILLLDDDVAMSSGLIVGPAVWREFFKPRLARVIRLAREVSPDLIIFYHSDGDFSRLVPELVEMGVNVINPVQPDCMDALALKREFCDRLALWGTVGSAWLWDRGTPDQVRAEVRTRIEMLGPGGLLLSPAYDVDFAPLANLVAFSTAVEEYGQFD